MKDMPVLIGLSSFHLKMKLGTLNLYLVSICSHKRKVPASVNVLLSHFNVFYIENTP